MSVDIQALTILPTGAANSRTFPATFSDRINLLDYILAADSSPDAGLDRALAAHNLTGKAIYIPSGVYNFTGAITETLPNATDSLTIYGDGPDATILHFPGSVNGITINYIGGFNTVHLRDFSITTAGTGLSAIILNQSVLVANPGNTAVSDITDVVIRGADSYASSNKWTTGIQVQAVSNINFGNLVVVGNAGATAGTIGVNLTAASNNFGVVYNFYGSTFNYLDIGISYGAYIQGVSVSACNFTGSRYGISWLTGTGTEQCAVSNSQFNCRSAGITLQGGQQLIAIGNLFIQAYNNAIGIHLYAANGVLVSGNFFQKASGATNTFGIQVEQEIIASLIVENNFAAGTPGMWFSTGGIEYQTVLKNNNYVSANFSLGIGSKVVLDSPQTVASLPAASSTFVNRTAIVTDSTTTTWGATVTGGGSSNVSVRCNGTNWTVVGA